MQHHDVITLNNDITTCLPVGTALLSAPNSHVAGKPRLVAVIPESKEFCGSPVALSTQGWLLPLPHTHTSQRLWPVHAVVKYRFPQMIAYFSENVNTTKCTRHLPVSPAWSF